MKIDKRKFIGIASGILGAVFLYLYTESLKEKAGISSGFVDVVIAIKDIERGERLREEVIGTRKIPRKYLSSSMIMKKDIDAVLIRRVVSRIPKGEYIMWQDVQEDPYGGFSSRIPSGKRAVAFKVDDVSSVGHLIRDGDAIDAIGVLRKDGELYSGFIVQNIPVLSGAGKGSSTIVLALTEEEAKALLLAKAGGEVFFILRNPGDSQVSSSFLKSYSEMVEERKKRGDEVILIKGR